MNLHIVEQHCDTRSSVCAAGVRTSVCVRVVGEVALRRLFNVAGISVIMACRHCNDRSCAYCLASATLFDDSDDDTTSGLPQSRPQTSPDPHAHIAAQTSPDPPADQSRPYDATLNAAQPSSTASSSAGGTVSAGLPPLGISRDAPQRTAKLVFGPRVAPYMGITRYSAEQPPAVVAKPTPIQHAMSDGRKRELAASKMNECTRDLSEDRCERIVWRLFSCTTDVEAIVAKCLTIANTPGTTAVKVGVSQCPIWRMFWCKGQNKMIPHGEAWRFLHVLALVFGDAAASLEAGSIDRLRQPSGCPSKIENVLDGGDGPIRPHKLYWVYCISQTEYYG